MDNKYRTVTHDLIGLFAYEDSEILILGTMPSIKTFESGFYYGHKMNRFYPVISKIFDESVPSTIEEKKSLLKKHHIALYDVIDKCDIINSSDASIKNVVPINILDILSKYPSIHKIILNGKLAGSLFDKYLLKDVGENIKIYYLPSTSPANARVSFDALVEAYKAAIIGGQNLIGE